MRKQAVRPDYESWRPWGLRKYGKKEEKGLPVRKDGGGRLERSRRWL